MVISISCWNVPSLLSSASSSPFSPTFHELSLVVVCWMGVNSSLGIGRGLLVWVGHGILEGLSSVLMC